MAKLKTYTKCSLCDGSGVFVTTSGHAPQEVDPCPSCSGEGYHEVGKAECEALPDDLQDQLDDIKDKLNDIFEKVSE